MSAQLPCVWGGKQVPVTLVLAILSLYLQRSPLYTLVINMSTDSGKRRRTDGCDVEIQARPCDAAVLNCLLLRWQMDFLLFTAPIIAIERQLRMIDDQLQGQQQLAVTAAGQGIQQHQ
jgi:hypothetical protein